jgi:hypothetical protein
MGGDVTGTLAALSLKALPHEVWRRNAPGVGIPS